TEEAKKQEIAFEGHVPDAVRASEMSTAGMKSFEHLIGIFEGSSPAEDDFLKGNKTEGKFLATYDAARAASLAEMLARNHTWQRPPACIFSRATASTRNCSDSWPRDSLLSKRCKPQRSIPRAFSEWKTRPGPSKKEGSRTSFCFPLTPSKTLATRRRLPVSSRTAGITAATTSTRGWAKWKPRRIASLEHRKTHDKWKADD